MMRDVREMTDSELAELLEQADIVAAARKEQERRRLESEGVKVVALTTPSVRRTTRAACPTCGGNEWIESKTMYDSPELAHGNVTGTAVCCKECHTWYDSTTGERVNIAKAYTY